MTSFSFHRFVSFPTALCLFLLATAADASVRFRALSWHDDITDLRYTSNGREVPLSVNARGLSSPYEFAGNGPLELYRIVTVDDQPVRQPVASLPVPAGLTRALLILHIAENGACSAKWLDDSIDATPAGMMRIHNLSTKEVAVGIGRDIRSIARGDSTGVTFPADARALPIRIAMRTGDHWDVAMSISQPVRARLRFMAIIRDGRPTLEEPDRVIDWMAFHEVPPSPKFASK